MGVPAKEVDVSRGSPEPPSAVDGPHLVPPVLDRDIRTASLGGAGGARAAHRRLISCPLVVADYQGERYLVAMLGQDANWVRNVRAAGGRAVLRHGRREAVRLDENEVGARAPILRRYLADAPVSDPGSLYCTGSR